MQIARMSRDEKTLWGLGVIFGGMIIIFNWEDLEKIFSIILALSVQWMCNNWPN